MDYFSPGLHELTRIAARARDRWRLRGARAALAKAESELGLLGWQQAEFDPETQREVEKIKSYESEQARLTNASAQFAKELIALGGQREEARKVFEEKRATLGAEAQKNAAAIAEASGQLDAAREQEAGIKRNLPPLERELREATHLYHELLKVEDQTQLARDEQARVRERTVGIPGEIAALQTQQARAGAEIEAHGQTLAERRKREAEIEKEMRELTEQYEEWDRVMQNEVKLREREKARIEKESDALEREKESPYRRIGRVLADNNLAPMNQPQALEAVRTTRLRVQELDFDIALSLATSAKQDRALVQHSLMLWGAIAFALAVVLGALIPW